MAAIVGIFSLALWPVLPDNSWLAVGLLLALLLARGGGRLGRLLAAALLGACWGVWVASGVEHGLLPERWDRDKMLLAGPIISPVSRSDDYWQFDLLAEQFERYQPADFPAAAGQRPRKVRLRLYRRDIGYPDSAGNDPLAINPEQLRAGHRVAVVATLRSPRGLANSALFNYRAWLLSQGYAATGYIRPDQSIAEDRLQPARLGPSWQGQVAALREQVITALTGVKLPALPTALLQALAVGDKSALAPWRERLVSLGIIHLVVISGLHVGIVGAIGWWLGRWLAALVAALSAHRGREWAGLAITTALAPLCAVGLALFYTLLAGSQLPALRALIALCWVAGGAWQRLRWAPQALLLRVVLSIAIVDPLAVISGSFWLSISAVTLLLVALLPRTTIAAGHSMADTLAARGRRWWLELLRVQGYLTLGMAPLLLALVGKLSWLGVAVNLLAVPWVTLLLVPLTLLAVAATLLLGSAAQPLWIVAGWAAVPLSWLVGELSAAPLLLGLEQIDSPAWLALLLCWLGLLLPRALLRWPLRALLVAPLCLLLAAGPVRPVLRLTVLDVGQGLAAVVEAGGRVLVYDSGARYSDLFDMGGAVVVPYLQRRGYRSIDRVLISHADSDHAGGYGSILEAYPMAAMMLPDELLAAPQRATGCQTAQRWQWGEVSLATLDNRGSSSRNDNSCVVQVVWRDVRLLLPGDIERSGERRLLASGQLTGPVTVLVAPHHGSKSSSSEPLLAALAPSYTVFSAGFNHHFGHPHPTVVARYERYASRWFNTATAGAVVFSWDSHGALTVEGVRAGWAPWWRY